MHYKKWRIQIKNKYYHLLGLLIAFFFILPLAIEQNVHSPVFSLVFLTGIIFTLRAAEVNGRAFWAVTLIGLLAYLFQIISGLYVAQKLRSFSYLVTLLIFIIFILVSVVFLAARIFSAKKITSDTIAGGISVYLLLGFLWALFYYTIYLLDRGAFCFPTSFTGVQFFYFSFSTLTTVGYGDIYPVSKFGMLFSSLEAVVGQMYVAIFIARLIGLHVVTNKGL